MSNLVRAFSRPTICPFTSLLHSHIPLQLACSMASIPSTMKGVQIEKTGGIEVLQYKDLPVPSPKDNEVLVKNEYIGVNYIDTYFRKGLYSNPLPMILGREGSGTIVSIGANVPSSLNFSIRDSVVYSNTSAYADYTACSADKVSRIPPAVSSANACAAFLQGLTALTLVEEAYRVQKGDWILVLAAAGGVGGWLCKILKAKGANTIATVGSQEKVQVAKEQGADVVVTDRNGEGEVLKVVKEYTNGEGVNAVFDGVGKDTFDRSLECVARKGTVASFGNASGPVEQFSILKLAPKSVKVVRPTLYSYIYTREEFEHYSNMLFKMIEEKKLDVRIYDTYPLSEVATAHTDIESRKTIGKLLLKP